MTEILDDIEQIRKIDKDNMLSKAYSLSDNLEEGWNLVKDTPVQISGEFNNIIISGMGGSAISGDIVSLAFSDRLKVPVYVNRNYDIPNFASDNTLFIAVSYSGNTEETLSAFNEALKKKCKIVTISSGGKLEKLSANSKFSHIRIPSGLPPRAALGYILSSLLHIFNSLKIAAAVEADLDEAIKLTRRMKEKYSLKETAKTNEIKQLAKKLQGKTPIIMSCIDVTYPAGLRLKTQLNENGKITALHSTFPELDHNDLVNFGSLKVSEHNFFAIILRDSHISGRMTRRIEVTKSLISANLKGFNEIWSQGKSKLARILTLILYGDILSVYLAVLNGTDPTPVFAIEQLKKELSR